MSLENILNFLAQFKPEILRLVVSLITALAIVIVYKIFSRSLSRVAKRFEFDPHLENSLRLILRVVMILVAITALFTVFELPTTWFVGSSALVGAAFGFGSSQTINNLVAGFYVIISRPFKVKDYVRIGDAVG